MGNIMQCQILHFCQSGFYKCGTGVNTSAFNMLVLMQQTALSSFLLSQNLSCKCGNQHCSTNTVSELVLNQEHSF